MMSKTRAWTPSGTFSSHKINKLVLLLISHDDVGSAVEIYSAYGENILQCNTILKIHKAQIFDA